MRDRSRLQTAPTMAIIAELVTYETDGLSRRGDKPPALIFLPCSVLFRRGRVVRVGAGGLSGHCFILLVPPPYNPANEEGGQAHDEQKG